MVNPQEAQRALNRLFAAVNEKAGNVYLYEEIYKPSVDTLQSLVNLQVPERPRWMAGDYYCPCCNHHLTSVFAVHPTKHKRCPECGKRLDWSGFADLRGIKKVNQK